MAVTHNHILFVCFQTNQIINMGNYKCLRTMQMPSQVGITLEACSETFRQKWAFENMNMGKLDRNLEIALYNRNITYKSQYSEYSI